MTIEREHVDRQQKCAHCHGDMVMRGFTSTGETHG